MKNKYEIRSTGRPFGPAEALEPVDFKFFLSRHATISAAEKKLSKYYGEMRKGCGQNAWDNHFSIFAVAPVSIEFTGYCPHCGWDWTVNKKFQPKEIIENPEIPNHNCDCEGRGGIICTCQGCQNRLGHAGADNE